MLFVEIKDLRGMARTKMVGSPEVLQNEFGTYEIQFWQGGTAVRLATTRGLARHFKHLETACETMKALGYTTFNMKLRDLTEATAPTEFKPPKVTKTKKRKASEDNQITLGFG